MRTAVNCVGRLNLHPLILALRLALVAGACSALGKAEAATITVGNNSDAGDGTSCTLRQAIAAANTDSVGTSTCTAGSGADTIVFAGGITSVGLDGANGALTLTSANATTIDGGAGVTISLSNGSSRILAVSAGATAVLSHITVSGGSSALDGGCIYSTGTLTLDNSTVSNCTAVTSVTGHQAAGLYSELGKIRASWRRPQQRRRRP